MGKRGERKLKQLYDLTKRLSKPEVTAVLGGCYHIQGPADEEEHKLQRRSSFVLPADGKPVLVNQTPFTRVEAGSCNVCSSPCSLCMHANKSLSLMASNSAGVFSDNMNKRKEADSCSSVAGNVHLKKSRRCANRQACSETSNLLRSTSSHDLFSESAQSKATSKASCAFDTTDDIVVPFKASSFIIEEKQLPEDHGDNISCVTGSTDGNAAGNVQNVGLGENKVILISDSTNHRVNEDSQVAIEVVATLADLDHATEGGQHKPAKLSACPEDRHQRNTNSPGSGTTCSPEQLGVSTSSVNCENALPPSSSVDDRQLHDLDHPKALLGDSSSRKHDATLNCFFKNLESSVGGHLDVNKLTELKSTQPSNSKGDRAGYERSNSSSRTSSSNYPQMGNQSVKDLEIPSEALECSRMDESLEKLASLIEEANTPSIQVYPQSNSEKGISESELEDDVKVCDICGDTGREECLAICSNCSDGAEHTYCMRTMMEKVPEGEWLCEECKMKKQTENQKVDTSELLSRNSKPSSSNEKSQKINDASPKILPKLRKKTFFSDKGAQKGFFKSFKTSSKQHTDLEVASKNGKYIPESTGEKKSILSLEGSFKNSNIEKGQPGSMLTSYGSQSAQNSPAFGRLAHSISDVSKGQVKMSASREPFSKSYSFNSSVMKRKVKQLTDDIPLKQKLTWDFTSKDMRKHGPAKTLRKSASFKGSSSGYIEPMAKCASPNSSCIEDHKDSKLINEKAMLERKNSFIAECSTFSAKLGSAIPAKSELKAASNEGKTNNMAEPNNLAITKGSGDASGLGRKEIRRQPSTLGKGLDNSSLDGACINEIHRLNLQRSVSQVAESTGQDNKGKDDGFSNISRQAAQASGRILRCQKCNETGHTSQYCSIDKLHLSAVKPSAESILKEENINSNKQKEIVRSATLRTRNSKFDQAKETSISNTAMGSNTKDLPNSPSFPMNLSSLDGRSDGQAKRIVEVGNRTYTADVNKRVVSLPCLPSSDEFRTKPFTEKLPSRASLLGSLLRSSAIPEFAVIWQGRFEVLKAEGIPEICDGMQAHLSSCASPSVLNVVDKFPFSVKLEEVPRQSLWPTLFARNGPKEDNIALFFFANDTESYERNYKKLLDNIIGNDLVLKGNINGVDLLIFPSSVLPDKFQRWNMLFFLWGAFRKKRMDSFEGLPQPHKRRCMSHLDVKAIQDASSPHTSEIPLLHKTDPCNSQDNESSVYTKHGKPSSTRLASEVLRSVSLSENEKKKYVSPEGHTEASSSRSSDDNKLPPSVLPCSFPDSSSKSIGESYGTYDNQNQAIPHAEIMQRVSETETDASYSDLFSNSKRGKLRDSGIQLCFCKSGGLPTTSVYRFPTPGKDMTSLGEEQIQVKNEPARDLNAIKIDNLSCDSRPGSKRSFSSSLDAVSRVSFETSKSLDEARQWKERAYCDGHASSSSSVMLSSSKLRPLLPSLNESHPVDDTFDEDVILQTSGSSERFLFPVDNVLARNVNPPNIIDITSSDDEDSPEVLTPDLELGLCGKKHPTKREALPLFLPLDKTINQENLPTQDEDEVSPSLSLSLAFPDSEKELKQKTITKSESVLSGQPCRNNSLLLFGGLTDT